MKPKDADLIALARLVASMRLAQREYFRTRTPADLERSKAIERSVDEEVKAILDPDPKLFD